MAGRAAAEPQVMVALTSFVGGIGHEVIDIREGDLFGSDDPAVAKWPQHFGPVTLRSSGGRRIEQATAAPGEKRGA